MKEDIAQIELYDKKLISILLWLEGHFNVEFKKTSGHRPGDSGVHGTVPCRGTDLSCPDRGFGELVEDRVNSVWEYDHNRPEKKCCLYHKTSDGEWHLHIQSHPNTRLR